MSDDAAAPCTHPARVDGVCATCGDCTHDVILNGACLACGRTDLVIDHKSPKPQQPPPLVPADRLRRK